MGITAAPLLQQLHWWDRGMPQYTVGHVRRVEAINERAARFPGLFLAGSSYRGVGIPAMRGIRSPGSIERVGTFRKTRSSLVMSPKSPLNVEKSRALFAEAVTLLPGGVDSPVRAFKAVGGEPLFIERGEGPWLFDVDGNRYIDYVLSWGPLVLGHAHPRVLAAIVEAASRGTSFGAPSPLELDLARLVRGLMPSVQMIRFVNSGTEAVMSALRLARAYTGRDKIVKFTGGYHGHADMLLVQAGLGGGNARPAGFTGRAGCGHRGHPGLRVQRPARRGGAF